LVALKHFGVDQDYILETRSKIDEAKKPVDELEKAAKDAMGVMNFIKAIRDSWDAWKKIQAIGKLVAAIPQDIEAVQEAWAATSTEEFKPMKEHLATDWLDKCRALPCTGVYGESGKEGGKVCPDISSLQKQIRDDYFLIRALDRELGRILTGTYTLPPSHPKYRKGHIGKPDEAEFREIKNISEEIRKQSVLVWGFNDATAHLSNKCTCGSCKFTFKITSTSTDPVTGETTTSTEQETVDLCKTLYCLPAIADMLGWDCDWELKGILQTLLDIVLPSEKAAEITGKLCKNDSKCNIPMPFDAIFSDAQCWTTWILRWVSSKWITPGLENALKNIP